MLLSVLPLIKFWALLECGTSGKSRMCKAVSKEYVQGCVKRKWAGQTRPTSGGRRSSELLLGSRPWKSLNLSLCEGVWTSKLRAGSGQPPLSFPLLTVVPESSQRKLLLQFDSAVIELEKLLRETDSGLTQNTSWARWAKGDDLKTVEFGLGVPASFLV